MKTDGPSRLALRQLVEAYACEVRKLSEELAALGGEMATGKDFQGTLAGVMKLRERSDKAGRNLFVVFEPLRQRATSAKIIGPATAEGNLPIEFRRCDHK